MLWAGQPQTLAELVTALDADTGWSRATIFMMLKRLIAKGAVTMDDSGKFQKYSAAITYSDVEPEETESFLSKVYGGSVGMMVSNLLGQRTASDQIRYHQPQASAVDFGQKRFRFLRLYIGIRNGCAVFLKFSTVVHRDCALGN